MSIKINNLENNNLLELTIADSTAIIGGTHPAAISIRKLALPKISIPVFPGSASTSSFTAISPNSAVSSNTALAFGPGTSATDTSAYASIDANGVRAGGGAAAVQTTNTVHH